MMIPARPQRIQPPTMHRLRQLMRSNSARWVARGDRVVAQTGEGDDEPAEMQVARFAEADAAELAAALHRWFHPLCNEVVMLRKRLADCHKMNREIMEAKEGLVDE